MLITLVWQTDSSEVFLPPTPSQQQQICWRVTSRPESVQIFLLDVGIHPSTWKGNSDRHLRLYCRHVQLVNVYPDAHYLIGFTRTGWLFSITQTIYKHVNMFKFKFTRYVGQDDCDRLHCTCTCGRFWYLLRFYFCQISMCALRFLERV